MLNLAGGAALGVALLCMGYWTSPVPMLLSVGTPFWALLALVAFTISALYERTTTLRMVIAALAFVALILLIINVRGLFPGTWTEERPDLRIVEFNLLHNNAQPEQAAAWIAAQKADVAVLLEAAGRSRKVVAMLRDQFPYRTSCRGDRPCSTVILSRIAPLEQRGLAHGDADNRRALSAALVRFGAPWPEMTLVAVHLSQPLPLGQQGREIDRLATALAGRSDRRLVITGDFNAPGWSITMRSLTARFGLHLLPTLPSWPANGVLPPLLDIDHSLVGGAWDRAVIQRGPALGSDHRSFLISLTAGHHAQPR